jgi:small subunit ribosomal protein S1
MSIDKKKFEDFLKTGEVKTSSITKSFDELIRANEWVKGVKVGSLLKANLISKQDKFYVFDAALKSEAFIPIEEFKGKELEINDTVTLMVVDLDDNGKLVLSYEKGQKKIVLKKIEKSLSSKEFLDFIMTAKVKNGFQVSYEDNAVSAFLPFSNCDQGETDSLVVKGVVTARVVKMEIKKEEEKGWKGKKKVPGYTIILMSKMYEENFSSIINCKIVEVNNDLNTLKVDCNDIVTEFTKPDFLATKTLKEGDFVKIKVKNSKYEIVKEENIYDIKEHSIVKGEVIAISNNASGAFVRIENKVEGFLHKNEVSWSESKRQIPSVGSKIEVYVVSVSKNPITQKLNISLSIKRCGKNLFQQFLENYENNKNLSQNDTNKNQYDVVEGTVTAVLDIDKRNKFIFVDICEGFEGVIFLDDLAWQEGKRVQAFDNINNGMKKEKIKLTTKILNINNNREYVSLGLKQLEKDPLQKMLEKYPIGSIVEGYVSEVTYQDIFLSVEGYTSGIVIKKKTGLSRDAGRHFVLKENEKKITAKIIGQDTLSQKLIASIRAYEADCNDKALEKYKENSSSTIGDSIKTTGLEKAE